MAPEAVGPGRASHVVDREVTIAIDEHYELAFENHALGTLAQSDHWGSLGARSSAVPRDEGRGHRGG
jgi:hypothetical protein